MCDNYGAPDKKCYCWSLLVGFGAIIMLLVCVSGFWVWKIMLFPSWTAADRALIIVPFVFALMLALVALPLEQSRKEYLRDQDGD